ncbi:hypothetical protein RvY_17764 [Ramazzottius varieornatus]|uniref:Mediator of RNA polymerase II transcription subunit 17 n=1 Tax=Ramazzottius varieornatus TaxID=947166 RepID=A0A1D1W6Z2_RAMVA|nr:hypothetical protein RvY_17764 [Ramazzottius varieornatus]
MVGDREEPSSSPAGLGSPAVRNSGRRDSANIRVTVECPLQPQISEITFDGQEIHQPPISRGERLYRNACKINFLEEDVEDGEEDELVSFGVAGGRPKETRVQRPDPGQIVWSLDSVRNKLRSAHMEVAILTDILALSKERKYMRVESAVSDPVESKPHFNMHIKKKAAQSVSVLFAEAANRLKRSAADTQKGDNDYHHALINLRDQWRLKKTGANVTGDLGYRTVGSALKAAGQFEIRKNEDNSEKPLNVVIVGDLSGECAVQIDIAFDHVRSPQKDYIDELRTHDMWSKVITADTPWHRQLTAAQNCLYLRELTMMLSAEAVNLPSSLSPIVFGDEVHYTSLFGHTVRVKLQHVPESEMSRTKSTARYPHNFNESTWSESRIVEMVMQMIMLTRMRDLSNPDIPIPACGPLGLKNFRRKMSIQARDRRVWKIPVTPERSLSTELLELSHNLLLRKRILKFLDELVGPDLTIIIHDTSTLTSWKYCLIKLSFHTPGFDFYDRTNCAFEIHSGEARFCTRNSVHQLSVGDDMECHLLYVEMVRHHSTVMQFLLKSHRFEIIQYNASYGFYELKEAPVSISVANALSYAITIVAKSSDERWLVKVVCSLCYVYRVYVASLTAPPNPTNAVRNKDFVPPNPIFREVDLNSIVGGDTRAKKSSMVISALASLPQHSKLLRKQGAEQETKLRRPAPAWTRWETVV